MVTPYPGAVNEREQAFFRAGGVDIAAFTSFECRHSHEIDKVTTPRGCTIAGLNEMEHQGFSSSMIRGIKTAAEKAAQLYSVDE